MSSCHCSQNNVANSKVSSISEKNLKCTLCKINTPNLSSQSGTLYCKDCLQQRINKKISTSIRTVTKSVETTVNKSSNKHFIIAFNFDLCSQTLVHLLAELCKRAVASFRQHNVPVKMTIVHIDESIFGQDPLNIKEIKEICAEYPVFDLKIIDPLYVFPALSKINYLDKDDIFTSRFRNIIIKMCLYSTASSMKAHAIIFSSSQTHLFRRIMYRLAIGQIGVFEQPEYLNKIKVAYPLSDIAVRDIAAYMALFQRKRIAKFAPKKTNSILKIITHFVLTQNVESSWASSSCGLLKKFTSISRKMCKICFQIIDKDSDKDYCDICTDIAKLYPRLFAEMERNQLCETN